MAFFIILVVGALLFVAWIEKNTTDATRAATTSAATVETEPEPIVLLPSVDLLQNERFLNLIKLIIDTPGMKLPLDQQRVEAFCNELKPDGVEITPVELQEDIRNGLLQYVVQNYVRVALSDEVWPEEHNINEENLDALHILLEQKGVIIPKSHLEQMVNTEYRRQELERFKESFFRFKPELRGVKDVERLVKGYVDIFEEAYWGQLEYFTCMVSDEVSRNIELTVLATLIQAEIKRRTDLRRAEEIKSAIQIGHVSKRRIQIEDIDAMGGHEFEHFLQKLFSNMGYRVEVTKGSGDQGADLIAEKFGSRVAIQAKRYTGSVGNKAVQEVISAMQYYKCAKGIVVTNSTFTKSAIELAQSSNVELIDRYKLMDLLDKYGHGMEAPESRPTTILEEVEYAKQFGENIQQFMEYTKLFNDLFSNIDSSDGTWLIKCRALFASMKTHIENAREMTPPKAFEHAHETYLKSMDLFDVAVQKMTEFIDTQDVNAISSLQDDLDQASEYFTQAYQEWSNAVGNLTKAASIQ